MADRKTKKIPEELIVSTYLELTERGWLKKDIANWLSVNQRTMYDVLKRNGISSRYKTRSKGLSELQKLEVIRLYQSGKTIKEVISLLEVTCQDIRLLVKQGRLSFRDSKDYAALGVNLSAFTDHSSEESPYFLGLLTADGCNTLNSIRISLQLGDKHILESLRDYINTRHGVKEYSRVDPRTGKRSSQASYVFAVDELTERLRVLGLFPNKSLRETYPEVYKYNRHFWRGLIDGDGNLSKTSNSVSLCGSECVVTGMYNYCKKLLPLSNPTVRKSQSSEGLFYFYLCSKTYSKLLLDELYRDCTLRLDRKFRIYKERYYD